MAVMSEQPCRPRKGRDWSRAGESQANLPAAQGTGTRTLLLPLAGQARRGELSNHCIVYG